MILKGMLDMGKPTGNCLNCCYVRRDTDWLKIYFDIFNSNLIFDNIFTNKTKILWLQSYCTIIPTECGIEIDET